MRSLMHLKFRPGKPKGIARVEPKRDLIWWPDRNALDRQRIEVGVPFKRKGEWILVERTKGGGFISSACNPPRKEEKSNSI